MTIERTQNYFFAQELGEYRIYLEKLSRNLKDLEKRNKRSEARNRRLRRKVKRLTRQLNASTGDPVPASSRERDAQPVPYPGTFNTDFRGALGELNDKRS